jgi:hypothetical protein
VRALATGTYEPRDVQATASPSMDIQVASNFERILLEAYGRDAKAVRGTMSSLAQSRRFALSVHALSRLRAVFSANRASEHETAATIRTMLRETGRIIDPHTAVGVAVAEKEPRNAAVPQVVLATAHAAKFPDAVEAACGVRPALPDWLADLNERPERATRMPVDQAAVERVLARWPAVRQTLVRYEDLCAEPQALPGSGEDLQLWGLLEDVRQEGGLVGLVFEAVQDQEEGLLPKKAQKPGPCFIGTRQGATDGMGDARHQCIPSALGWQGHEDDTVAEFPELVARDLEREAGLADAARPEYRDETGLRVVDQRLHLAALAVSTDERCGRHGQVTPLGNRGHGPVV